MTKGQLTKAQAKALCVAALGSAAGFETVERGREYRWQAGNTRARITAAPCDKAVVEIRTEGAPGVIEAVYDLDGLVPDYEMSDDCHRETARQRLQEWVWELGAERCCERIKKIWEARYDDR